VGPSDWTNVRRTFQGASAIVDVGTWRVTPFWSELVVVNPETFDEASPGSKLYGVYASGGVAKTVQADVSWLSANNASASFNGTSGHELRQTIGARLWRGRSRLTSPQPRDPRWPGLELSAREVGTDFDVEVAGQFGSLGGQDIRASMISANAGHTFDWPLAPRFFATMDYASGR